VKLPDEHGHAVEGLEALDRGAVWAARLLDGADGDLQRRVAQLEDVPGLTQVNAYGGWGWGHRKPRDDEIDAAGAEPQGGGGGIEKDAVTGRQMPGERRVAHGDAPLLRRLKRPLFQPGPCSAEGAQHGRAEVKPGPHRYSLLRETPQRIVFGDVARH